MFVAQFIDSSRVAAAALIGLRCGIPKGRGGELCRFAGPYGNKAPKPTGTLSCLTMFAMASALTISREGL